MKCRTPTVDNGRVKILIAQFLTHFLIYQEEFSFIAELWRAKRACGAPWVSKSTHPRKFGNHVTVHRPQPARPSAPQAYQRKIWGSLCRL